MFIRRKIAAAAGALALIALVPTPAEAQTGTFTVEANRNFYNVVCRDGADLGTAPIRLRVTNVADGFTATRWEATWAGSSTETPIIITAEARSCGASPGTTVRCPARQVAPAKFPITVPAFNSAGAPIGGPIFIDIDIRRVASASGPSGPGVTPGTEVLGTLFIAPEGP